MRSVKIYIMELLVAVILDFRREGGFDSVCGGGVGGAWSNAATFQVICGGLLDWRVTLKNTLVTYDMVVFSSTLCQK